MDNGWRDCLKNPPPEYVRVEIKTTEKEKIPGYRYKHKYYSTFGNFVIDNPVKWRYIPTGSYLYELIKRKLNSGLKQQEVAYDKSN